MVQGDSYAGFEFFGLCPSNAQCPSPLSLGAQTCRCGRSQKYNNGHHILDTSQMSGIQCSTFVMSFTSHASGETTDFQIRTLRLRQAAEPRLNPHLPLWSGVQRQRGLEVGFGKHTSGEARPGQCPLFPERWTTSCPLLALGPPCTSSEVAILLVLPHTHCGCSHIPLPTQNGSGQPY